MLIIQGGGIGIPTKQNGDLIFEIGEGLSNIMSLMAYCTISWHRIFPRKNGVIPIIKNGVIPIIKMLLKELVNELINLFVVFEINLTEKLYII